MTYDAALHFYRQGIRLGFGCGSVINDMLQIGLTKDQVWAVIGESPEAFAKGGRP